MLTAEILSKYEMTIGIECHVQLSTKTKLFSGADNDARDREPNSAVSPIDYGLPGMLPVLNKEAINLAVKAGLALNSQISLVSRFDRKHYFYPDLPKGYQITQMYEPIIGPGYVLAPLPDGGEVKVRIHHAHLEEDAGKLTHEGDASYVDLNRAGTPLIEIVSEPDIHSPVEAKAYASELHRLMVYAGVTHGDLYHGNMRFDVNISVAPKDSDKLGNRAEVKNLNSFRSVERAAEYEFKRQVELLEAGERIVQETRGWVEAKQKTISQRSKEDAQDYRYMPDADIPPVVLTSDEIAALKDTMPTLPPAYRRQWEVMELDSSVVDALLADPAFAETVTSVLHQSDPDTAKRTAHWFASALGRVEDGASKSLVIPPVKSLIELANMARGNEVSSTAAKDVFIELTSGQSDSPRAIAERRNLIQVSDVGAIAAIVDEVLSDPGSQKAIADIRAGNDKVIGYLIGQVMKKSKGKANPALAGEMIKQRLEK